MQYNPVLGTKRQVVLRAHDGFFHSVQIGNWGHENQLQYYMEVIQ